MPAQLNLTLTLTPNHSANLNYILTLALNFTRNHAAVLAYAAC